MIVRSAEDTVIAGFGALYHLLDAKDTTLLLRFAYVQLVGSIDPLLVTERLAGQIYCRAKAESVYL